MTQVLRTALTLILTAGVSLAAAQAPQPAPAQTPAPAGPPPAVPGTPAAQTPPAAPGAPVPAAPVIPGTVKCPIPVPPATAPARSFNAEAGLLFFQVVPAREADFLRFIAYVRDALAKTTNATFRQQARGLTIHRALEAGPNGDALYMLVLNPAVPCVDYALGPILNEVYSDPAQLGEIFKLYTNSVRPSGTFLLSLVPAPEVPLTPPVTPPVGAPGATTPATGSGAGAPGAATPGAKPAVPPSAQKPPVK